MGMHGIGTATFEAERMQAPLMENSLQYRFEISRVRLCKQLWWIKSGLCGLAHKQVKLEKERSVEI